MSEEVEIPRFIMFMAWLTVGLKLVVEVAVMTTIAILLGAPYWVVVPLFAIDFAVNGIAQAIVRLDALNEGIRGLAQSIDQRPIELPSEQVAIALAQYVQEINLRAQAPNN